MEALIIMKDMKKLDMSITDMSKIDMNIADMQMISTGVQRATMDKIFSHRKSPS